MILKNSSNFKGNVVINNGTIEVSALGANEGNEYGALGHYSNAITINGAALLAPTTPAR